MKIRTHGINVVCSDEDWVKFKIISLRSKMSIGKALGTMIKSATETIK